MRQAIKALDLAVLVVGRGPQHGGLVPVDAFHHVAGAPPSSLERGKPHLATRPQPRQAGPCAGRPLPGSRAPRRSAGCRRPTPCRHQRVPCPGCWSCCARAAPHGGAVGRAAHQVHGLGGQAQHARGATLHRGQAPAIGSTASCSSRQGPQRPAARGVSARSFSAPWHRPAAKAQGRLQYSTIDSW